MSKYFVLAAALIVLAIACNKKEEAPAADATVEQAAPAEAAPEAAPAEVAPEAAPATEEAPAQ